VGYYDDSSGVFHSFLRNADGSFVLFDVPGSIATEAMDINNNGQIAGDYSDIAGSSHIGGFLRNTDGSIATFSAPDDNQTVPNTINDSGQIAGYYADASFHAHGFVRDSGGGVSTFDIPESSGGLYVGTINNAGLISGGYNDSVGKPTGFLGDGGSFATFDAPASISTYPNGLNDLGQVVGRYQDSTTGKYQGFLRSSGGSFETISGPVNFETFPNAINNAGQVEGHLYNSSTGNFDGFLRTCGSNPPPNNQPPTATADAYQASQGATLTVTTPGVLGNDSDPDGDAITAVLDTQPTHGTLALNADGSFTYTPTPSFVGNDTFTYRASDGALNSVSTTVTITVAAVCKTKSGTVITGLTSLENLETLYPPPTPGLAVDFNNQVHANPANVPLYLNYVNQQLVSAVDNFRQRIAGLGATTFTITSGYRPAAYL
jgi:VCBS repeat-containing protein